MFVLLPSDFYFPESVCRDIRKELESKKFVWGRNVIAVRVDMHNPRKHMMRKLQLTPVNTVTDTDQFVYPDQLLLKYTFYLPIAVDRDSLSELLYDCFEDLSDRMACVELDILCFDDSKRRSNIVRFSCESRS